MDKPLIVSIPHSLGKAEATRRLKSGLDTVRAEYASLVNVSRADWEGGRLSFEVSVLKQLASGTVDVEEDYARLEVKLPWLLARFAATVQARVAQRGTLLLGGKG